VPPPLAGDVGFGLGAAAGYGSADFLAKGAADRIGFLASVFYLELFATPPLIAVALLLEPGARVPLEPLLLLLGLTLVNLVGTLFLYRAFEFGTLSIVSPLVSGYPALIVALSVLALHEPLTAADATGIALTLAGGILLARGEDPERSRAKAPRVGLVSAAIAFVAYGVFYFALVYVIGPIPPLTAAAISRGASAVPAAILLAARGGVRWPGRSAAARLGAVALLDGFAFVSYVLGLATVGSLAVLGTVSGLFAAVTVGWATAFLGDRLRFGQWVGVLAVFSGVVVLALLSGA
jgi:drug/metabolite transporter (DMT)-like permease